MTEPTRPATADRPPTDGEVAARRLIRGHLDTSGLDDVTAKAVELLVAADEVAAAAYMPHRPRLWRSPLWLLSIVGLTVLVMLSAAVLVLIRGQQSGDEQRQQLVDLTESVRSCVDPNGECAKRGREQTGAAVAELQLAQLVAVECADAYDGRAAIERCVAERLPAGR